MGSRLAEPSHLRLLLFQLLLQAEKRLGKLLVGVSGFEHSRKRPLGRGGRKLGIFSVGDVNVRSVGMTLVGSATLTTFPFPFDEAGVAAGAWETFFLGGAMSAVRGCFEEGLGFESGRDLRV